MLFRAHGTARAKNEDYPRQPRALKHSERRNSDADMIGSPLVKTGRSDLLRSAQERMIQGAIPPTEGRTAKLGGLACVYLYNLPLQQKLTVSDSLGSATFD